MTAICGMVGRHEAPAGGVDAMLAAMTHSGAAVASWADAGVGLGRRCDTGEGAGWFMEQDPDGTSQRDGNLVIYDLDHTVLAEWEMTGRGDDGPQGIYDIEDRATEIIDMLNRPGRDREKALRTLGWRAEEDGTKGVPTSGTEE